MSSPVENFAALAQRSSAARVIPRRRLGRDLEALERHARRRERGRGIGLRQEGIDGVAGIVPALHARLPRANAGCHRQLSLGRVVLIKRADFEQRAVQEAAIGIALRRSQQVRQNRGPHLIEIGADRIGKGQSLAAASEQLGLRFR